jgi:DNA-binding MarR family transcriptional regulator
MFAFTRRRRGQGAEENPKGAPYDDDMATTGENGSSRNWTFLTNHGHVLLAIARNPTARLRDVADEVGVTERAAQAIVADLEAGGYLNRTRVGRRNEYTLNPAGRFRHPAEADRQVGDLLALFTDDAAESTDRS